MVATSVCGLPMKCFHWCGYFLSHLTACLRSLPYLRSRLLSCLLTILLYMAYFLSFLRLMLGVQGNLLSFTYPKGAWITYFSAWLLSRICELRQMARFTEIVLWHLFFIAVYCSVEGNTIQHEIFLFLIQYLNVSWHLFFIDVYWRKYHIPWNIYFYSIYLVFHKAEKE